jgi:hypothetical protein
VRLTPPAVVHESSLQSRHLPCFHGIPHGAFNLVGPRNDEISRRQVEMIGLGNKSLKTESYREKDKARANVC